MKVIPLLWQMRAAVSNDGRIAKFFLTFKGGQHSAFAIPFHKAGLFIKAIRSTIAMMSDRLAAQKPDATAEIAEGLGQALTVKNIVSGKDAETEEKLLWIETVESGPFAFRLTPDAADMLADVVRPDGQGDMHNAA